MRHIPTQAEELFGAKKITILASTRYPVVSAYEFETLKQEEVIRQRMKDCTLYLIMQRPLTYMTDVYVDGDGIHFQITDDTQPALRCHFSFVENGIAAPGETMDVQLLFLKKTPDVVPPFGDVGGFKVWRQDGTFVVWYSPHKFLYEVIAGALRARVEGDPSRFLDFKLHYIGQAFSQEVWRRLTGHEKLQSVLTSEGPRSEKPGNRVAWEVAIAMLSIDGYDEVNMFPVQDWMDLGSAEPLLHRVEDDDDLKRLTSPAIRPGAPELTNEAEAMLISRFKPSYNRVLYQNYPDIANGTRSVGYTDAELVVTRLPISLYTDAYRVEPVLSDDSELP